MSSEEQFKTRLREVGERVTKPRLVVFKVLLLQAPAPMGEVIRQAAAQGVDTVTVYRTIDLFRKLGLVAEVGLGRNRMLELSDEYQAHHHHVICVQCGGITDFDSAVIEAELARVADELGYDIRTHQLEATGVCGRCRLQGQSGR